MNKTPTLSNAVLWAAAILAAALLDAPPLLSLVLLPTLANVALLTAARRRCG